MNALRLRARDAWDVTAARLVVIGFMLMLAGRLLLTAVMVLTPNMVASLIVILVLKLAGVL